VATHVSQCAECQRVEERTRRVVDLAAALPAEVQPERDLWPEIAGRLSADVVRLGDRRGGARRARWAIVAAALVVMAAIAAVTLRSGGGPADVRPAVSSAGGTALAGFVSDPDLAAAITEYRRAAAALRAALARQSRALPPETRRVVESNLAVIDAAVARLTSALAADPGNHDLALLLTAAYERQLDLLLTANQLTRT